MNSSVWKIARERQLHLGPAAVVMGILNVTPDSFSDGGRYAGFDAALAQARRMIAEGAAIVDVGGESTRPGGEPVDAAEEQRRALPMIEALAAEGQTLISIDTWRAETARLALEAGAHIVNDIWGGQREPEILRVARDHGAGMVLMHNSRERDCDPDPVADQRIFLERSLRLAAEAGVEPARIVLDPGLGFGKDAEENLALCGRFAELLAIGGRWMIGASRKRFIGAVTGSDGDDRDLGTAAVSVALRMKGAALFRVHNVAINVEALKVADAIIARQQDV